MSTEPVEQTAEEAARVHENMLVVLDTVLTRAFERINRIPRIDELYRNAGIAPSTQSDPGPLEPVDLQNFATFQTDDGYTKSMDGREAFLAGVASYSVRNRRHLYALARAFSGDGLALKRMSAGSMRHLWQNVQDEIGVPGTRITDGRLYVDPNPRLRPILARGRNGNPGEYQNIRRTDVQTYRQVNEVSSLICNATTDPVVPHSLPGLDEVVRRADLAIQNAMGEDWRGDASSFTYVGFAPSELIWEVKKDGFTCLNRAAYREPSTVDRWLFDDRGSELVGAEFEGWTNEQWHDYVLPKGMTPDTARLLLVNIGAVGNDVEGVPPTRPCISLEKLRQLIVQSYGISYQRFGVPLLRVYIELVEELTKILPMFGGAPSKPDLQNLVNQLDNVRAHQPGSVRLPPGVGVDYMQPLGDIPDPLPMLRYIDECKAMAWTNEASTLGRSNYGSYAMADASDAKYMRTAPAFMRPFIRAQNHVLKLHILWNYDRADEIEQWPHYSFRFAGTQNSTKWLQDARETIAAQPWNWPEQARRMAAQSLMLPPETFDSAPAALAALADRESEFNDA